MKNLLRSTISLGALAAVAAGPALAADIPVKAPVVAQAFSWTGFYVGVHAGGQWTRNDGRWDPLPTAVDFGEFPIVGNFKDTVFVGGIHEGYNWQFAPRWVAGIELDWSWTDA